MGCFAGIVGNNVIGFFHAQTKVRRSLQRKGRDYIHELMTDVQEFNPDSAKDYKFPVLVGRPNLQRLHSCFRHISYGLFHNKFGKRFIGQIHILIDFILIKTKRQNNINYCVVNVLNLSPTSLKRKEIIQKFLGMNS
jgi:hypothetical protein